MHYKMAHSWKSQIFSIIILKKVSLKNYKTVLYIFMNCYLHKKNLTTKSITFCDVKNCAVYFQIDPKSYEWSFGRDQSTCDVQEVSKLF